MLTSDQRDLSRIDILQDVLVRHGETEHITPRTNPAVGALHGFQHEVPIWRFELVGDDRGPTSNSSFAFLNSFALDVPAWGTYPHDLRRPNIIQSSRKQ